MASVGEHYEGLLADLYAWMLGDVAERARAQTEWLRPLVGDLAPRDGTRPRALDLGAGTGAEAIALARLGYDVVAVDASAKLVAEITGRIAEAGLSAHVDVVQADLVDHTEREAAVVELVTCLGDTITHLPDPAAVQRLFRASRARLAPGGKLVLTYRDLSVEREGLDRFFLVRADASRILTCFVEYQPGRAIVHDLVHTRTDAGFELRKSSYPKLRLAASDVCDWLRAAGFDEVERVATGGGLVGLIAR